MEKLKLFNLLFISNVLLIFFCNDLSYSSMSTLTIGGYLSNENGNPINKTVKMKFVIYKFDKNQWSRERFVTLNDGKFDLVLGMSKPLSNNFFDGNHYLGISIKDNEKYKEVKLRNKIENNGQLSIIKIKTEDYNLFNSTQFSSTSWFNEGAQLCDVAFSQGIRDNYYLLTENDQFITYQERICKAQFESYEKMRESSSSLGLSFELADILLGLDGSHDQKSRDFLIKYNQFCHSTYYDYENHDKYRKYINTINSELTSSWVKCVELYLDAWLNSQGIFIDVIPQDDFSTFVVHVSRRAVNNDPIIIQTLNPEGSVECRRSGKPIKVGETLIDQNSFSMTCYKHPNQTITFSMDTNNGTTNTVKIPGNSKKVLELSDQNRALHSKILSLETQLTKINNNIPKSFDLQCMNKSLTGKNYNNKTLYCDDGYLITGGGCVWRSDGNDRLVYSHPNGNGWFCKDEDYAFVSEIWAVCCTIEKQY